MSLSDPRIIFGIHSLSPYNRTTKEFYGILRVLGESSLSLSGDVIELNGGSNKYPWAVEDGLIKAEMSLKPKEYPDFLFELFLGKAPTASGSDATGTVSTLTNAVGSSIKNNTTGIASVSITASTGAASLKFAKFVVKYASATTVDVFASSNIDFARGTDADYSTDLLKVASGVAVTSGGATAIPTLGLDINGGSGTIAFVAGDTATFQVKPPSSKSMDVVIGANSDVFPEFGAILVAKKRSNLEMFEIDAHRVKGVGLPLGFKENAFSEADIKAKCFYDSTLDRVLTLRHITPTS